jgi:hypothetical protein
VVDAEAEPARVAVGGGDVVDVEEDRRRRRLARAAAAARLPRGPRRRGGAGRGAHQPAAADTHARRSRGETFTSCTSLCAAGAPRAGSRLAKRQGVWAGSRHSRRAPAPALGDWGAAPPY